METLSLSQIFTIDKWLQVYLILMIIDYSTGILKAYKVEGFKSRKLRDGVIRSLTELIAIVFSGILDITFGLNILMVATKTLFIFKEAISIIENFGALGITLPKIVQDKVYDLSSLNSSQEEVKKEEEEGIL